MDRVCSEADGGLGGNADDEPREDEAWLLLNEDLASVGDVVEAVWLVLRIDLVDLSEFLVIVGLGVAAAFEDSPRLDRAGDA